MIGKSQLISKDEMMIRELTLAVLIICAIKQVNCLENGLVLTPPMAWMAWAKYTCNIDCTNYPNECINEKLFIEMIDKIVDDGYLELGYDYVDIDDCWMERERDPNTLRLVASKDRFPSGIAKLADYAHSKGVKLGIYEDVGTLTCMGYPGTRDHKTGKDYTYIDAQTFSDWKVDALKLDGCYPQGEFSQTYPEYRRALSQVEKKIAYSCSWPAYLKMATDQDFALIKKNCNYWRNYDDIEDSWQSVLKIIQFYGNNVTQFARKYHGPGSWFDADMLLIGNDGLSYEQSKTQMAFWSLWSVPLIMSNDLRNIKHESKQILQNRHLISINQDALGIMGHIVYNESSSQVWVKKLSPETGNESPHVVLYFNYATLGVPKIMSYQLSHLIPEINKTLTYDVYDIYANNTKIESLKPHQKLTLKVKTSGSVRIVKLVPVV